MASEEEAKLGIWPLPLDGLELGLSHDTLVFPFQSITLRNLEAMGNDSVTFVKRTTVRMQTGTIYFMTEPESCH